MAGKRDRSTKSSSSPARCTACDTRSAGVDRAARPRDGVQSARALDSHAVARARRALVDALPDRVYNRADAALKGAVDTPSRARHLRQGVDDGADAAPKIASGTPSRSRHLRHGDDDSPRPALNLRDDRQTTCKSRPASGRGRGSGRSYVPWCSRRR